MNIVLLVLCLAATSPVTDDSRRQRYDLLVKEYVAMELGWTNQFKDSELNSPLAALTARYEQWPAWRYLPRFHQVVEENPNDPVAGDAFFWILDIGRAVGVNDEEFSPILELCLESLAKSPHLQDVRMKQAFRFTLDRPSPVTEPFVRLAVEKCQSRELRAQALLALGTLLKDRAKLAEEPWFEDPKITPFQTFIASRMDPRVRKYLKETDLKASRAEAKIVLNKLIKEYGDVAYSKRPKPAGGAVTIADLAQPLLDELQATLSGAMELEGSDIEGKPLSLADYRGKVVVLVFWQSTNAPSLEWVACQRALSERLKGKPFAVLGVNCDTDRDTVRAAILRERINWPSWWDSPPEKAIRLQWKVKTLPMVYVLDAKGEIRHQGLSEKEEMERIVSTLVEAESKRQSLKE